MLALNVVNVCCLIFSDVYTKLVVDGTIVPQPETAPPTVPMDFNWARVCVFLFPDMFSSRFYCAEL